MRTPRSAIWCFTAGRGFMATHDQVFGHLRHEQFSASEAAEYLEISMPTFRRLVQSEKLAPSNIVGRNQMFSAQALRAFKRMKR